MFISITLSSSQWILIRLYTYWCSINTFKGLVHSWLGQGVSPICHLINHVQISLSDNFVSIWTTALTGIIGWLATKIIF